MNLSEALDAALPEMPAEGLSRNRPPRIDPDLVTREEVLDGEPIIGVLRREKGLFFRFTPDQWRLALLFDGSRSYEEIADIFAAETGIPIGPADARGFADSMETSEFWYKTPQEKNLALSEKLLAQRGRRSKSKVNFAHISFSAWDPDAYLGWLDRAAGSIIYSRWTVVLMLMLFAYEGAVFFQNWSVIGPDTKLYYSFAHKSSADLFQFWILLFAIGFLHESAHGLTCKHFGGQVHQMGLMLIYFIPCFFADTTEAWISGTKPQRMATIISGIWIETVAGGLATVTWAYTTTGTWLHDFSYQIILLTGVAAILINLNPLIKLDGYYLLTEAIEIPELKERSTAFATKWFQRYILKLPEEVPVVPKRRVLLFAVYALVSGAYSYILLFFFIRFSYNVTSKWFAEFAVIPAGAIAFLLFRARLRALGKLLARVWDHSFGSGVHWRPVHTLAIALMGGVLFLPLWRDRENAFFVIEPMHPYSLHPSVPGQVSAVLVDEGESVRAGQPLLRMSSITAASMQSAASAQTGSARFQAFNSEIQGKTIGSASVQQDAAVHAVHLAGEAQSSLVLSAPADGIVLTENPRLLLQQNVAAGQPVLDLAGDGPRLVRVFIPATALDRIPKDAEVALDLPGQFRVARMSLAPLDGQTVPLPPGLIAMQDFKGIQLAAFYCSRMALPAANGNPLYGLAGDAKIYGVRRSLVERIANMLYNLAKAHIW